MKINMSQKKACGLHCTKINNISVKFGKDVIIKNINIHIHCGELTIIIGKNGAGKTTLLKAILGEIEHTGNITFIDQKDNLTKRIKIGYVPQKLDLENSPITVYDMVASFSSNKPTFLFKSKKLYEKIKEHLKDFGADNLIDRKVNRLSGGELQRVMLGMAMMSKPDLLILDEPISGIDKNGKEQFYKKIYDLKKSNDMAIILVSHDFEYVKKYADDVILLNQVIEKEGTPDEVFKSKIFIDTFGEV